MPVLSEPRSWAFECVGPAFSANSRLHWSARSARTAVWRATAAWHARAARIPRLGRARIVVEWLPGDRRRRDPGNAYPAAKACVDGIVADAGVLVDDDAAHLEGPDLRLGEVCPVSSGYWRLRVTVMERAS